VRRIAGGFKLTAAVNKALADPMLPKKFEGEGTSVTPSASPEAFAAFIRAEKEKWAKVAKDAGMVAK
jgi:tripartite-type tricarboxylate transporter receptor subunit TctC